MTRAQIARDIAAQKGIDCPTEGTKAWLALVLEGTEAQLEAATDAADLSSSDAGGSGGDGSAHPLGSSSPPPGEGYVQFCAVRNIPGAVVGPGLVMAQPSYAVLQAASYVWITRAEYDAADRRLRCMADGSIVED